MPGIDCLAPERQDTSSGLSRSPKRLRVADSIARTAARTSSHNVPGSRASAARKSRHAAVLIVKPGGTGMPRLLISARFAPLPPSSARTACQSPPTLARTAAISLNW